MIQNTKRNEHPACGCASCRRGSSSKAGQWEHQQVNRAIRRRNKQALKLNPLDAEPIVVSTPYTD